MHCTFNQPCYKNPKIFVKFSFFLKKSPLFLPCPIPLRLFFIPYLAQQPVNGGRPTQPRRRHRHFPLYRPPSPLHFLLHRQQTQGVLFRCLSTAEAPATPAAAQPWSIVACRPPATPALISSSWLKEVWEGEKPKPIVSKKKNCNCWLSNLLQNCNCWVNSV